MNPPFPASSNTQQLAAKLLRVLREGAAPVSELAAALGISINEPSALADHLESLGWNISRNPLLGYSLASEPDGMSAEAILSYISGEWVPKIETLHCTTSTNTDAFLRGTGGETGPLVIIAEHQTNGRGRLGRLWDSPAGEGLWMSFLLRPDCPPKFLHRITSLTALALSESVEAVTGVQARIKWPNDVLVDGRKVAGILAETGASKAGAFVVVGVGINVNQTTFPEIIAHSAASLRKSTGRPVNRARLAGHFIGHYGKWLDELGDGFATALEQIKIRSSVLGRNLTLYAGSTCISGQAEDLSDDGELILRLADGSVRAFNAGEVSLNVR